jgi:DNA-binding CsgD family transcriptional regulator
VVKPRPREGPARVAVTARQREVIGLIARGFTNKEIAHDLGITERGAAAHVSRLLQRFAVPNRAGLTARALSQAVGDSVEPLTVPRSRQKLTAAMERELEPYRTSLFGVAVTEGRDNLVVFANAVCRKQMGVGPEVRGTPIFTARRASPTTERFRQASREAFETKRAKTIEGRGTKWLRDDGTWTTDTVSCVLQPIHTATAGIFGLLWICVAGPRRP